MSLIGALDTGSTALAVQQATLQVTGNNIANASNADYTRETVDQAEIEPSGNQSGFAIGTGVEVTGIQRQIDESLNERLRNATSDNSGDSTEQTWLTQIQTAFNALSGSDTSSSMDTFFNSWSDLANNPTDAGQRQVVLQDGASLATSYNDLDNQLGTIQNSIDSQLQGQASSANTLVQNIASLNGQIVVAQAGANGQANGLEDQRDSDLKQLSQIMNITTLTQPNGEVNVYVGSNSLVQGTHSNGVAITQQTDASGNVVPAVTFATTGGTIPVTGGTLGGLLSARGKLVGYEASVNTIANSLIYEVNKLHSSGQGTEGYTSVTSTANVKNATTALNDPATGLKFTPTNGSFVVHVTDPTTGSTTSTLVQVNLNGGTNQTSLNSLTASLNGIAGVTATVNNGQLTIAASSAGDQISFSQDSSGALASLGINTFFTGNDATNIAVNPDLTNNPDLLAAAQNGEAGDNQTAVAIAKLGSAAVASLNGQSIDDAYQGMINTVGTDTATAQSNASASLTVQQTLTTQQSSLSGVSLNEEMVNLIQQQNGFQAASRVVTAVQTMMQTLIDMV